MSETLGTKPVRTADAHTGLRRRILDAAAAVIVAKGPGAASIEDFVAATDVARDDFLSQFPTVMDVLQALNARITRELDWGLEDARNTIDDPVELMAAILHRIWAATVADPVKGWVAIRLEGSVAPVESVWQEQFDVLHRRAVSDGRFHPADLRAARTLAFGSLRMAMREYYLGRVGVDQGHHLIVMLLTAFGLPPAEASAISRLQDLTGAISGGQSGMSH
jgi:AcrR family transcriptional regulator